MNLQHAAVNAGICTIRLLYISYTPALLSEMTNMHCPCPGPEQSLPLWWNAQGLTRSRIFENWMTITKNKTRNGMRGKENSDCKPITTSWKLSLLLVYLYFVFASKMLTDLVSLFRQSLPLVTELCWRYFGCYMETVLSLLRHSFVPFTLLHTGRISTLGAAAE